ncbi:MAG: SDR family oxidoreductase [Catalinimonas sp.]
MKAINLLRGLVLTGGIVAARKLVRDNRYSNFYDKVVLITGGSRGLGLVMARQLTDEGAKLALVARNEEELERAKRELDNRGGEVLIVPGDVTDPEQVHEIVAKVRDHYGAVDVLINNAGVIQVGPMETMTRHEYEEALKTHFWAPYHVTMAVVPMMRARRWGRIVNVASVGGVVGLPHMMPYSASKHALVGFSDSLRAELMPHGILVTTACPGLVRTGSPRNVTVKGQHEEEYAWFKIADSLPGLSMSAESTAQAILNAARFGEASVITTIPAKIMSGLRGLFPGLTSDLMSVTNRLLPGPGHRGGTIAKKGWQSESKLSQSFLTKATQTAARTNNEM